MTVEIIKRGSLTYDCECKACKTLFRFGPDDAKQVGEFRLIDCPVCRRTCLEAEWKWPEEAYH